MPDEIRVEVTGADELVRDTAELAASIEKTAQEAFERVAGDAADAARSRVPVLTGRLQASITAEAGEEGRVLVGMGGPGVEYAGWVEFGGSRGRPLIPQGRYLLPAATEETPALVEAADQAARDAIERMEWSNPA